VLPLENLKWPQNPVFQARRQIATVPAPVLSGAENRIVSDLTAPSGSVGGVKRIVYSQRMQGRMTAVGPGLVDVELTGAHATSLGRPATFAAQLAFVTRRSFGAEGTIAVDGEPALRFQTIGHGVLAPAADADFLHGTAVLDAWGIGPLSGARGRITSNFIVAGNGALSDEQVVVLFIDEQGEGSQ
jgi:hypothetical protein